MKKLLAIALISSSIFASNLSEAAQELTEGNYNDVIEILSKMKESRQRDMLLAKAYFNRHLSFTDYKMAYKYFFKAHTNEALYYLGIMNLKGLGCEKNIQRGIKYLKESHHPKALYELAKFYLNGQYVLKDPKEAIKLLKQASKKGSKQAQALLGKLYLEGKYVEKNLQKGAELLKKSYQEGNEKVKELWNKYDAWKFLP